MSAKEVCTSQGDSKKYVLTMPDEIEFYHMANGITRRDSTLCLEEYAPKFNWWKTNARVLDIGTCDGSVTEILSRYLPSDYEVLLGADIQPKAIKFANEKYGNKRIKFIHLNIEKDIPDNLKNSFDHVFSFFTFHWVDDHEKAFTNVYNLLEKNGEFFSIFFAFSDVYFVFEILSKTQKWGPWMNDFQKFPSPYYDFEDPDVYVSKLLRKIGFNVLDVRCKQRVYYYENIEIMRGILTAISPFNIPKDLWPEFLDEFIETQRSMRLIDESKGTIKHHYNLMVIHCTK